MSRRDAIHCRPLRHPVAGLLVSGGDIGLWSLGRRRLLDAGSSSRDVADAGDVVQPSAAPATATTPATAAATTPAPSATSPAPSAASTSVGAKTGSSAALDQQTAKDESSEGSSVVEQFLAAVDAQDSGAAGSLLAPDADFQLEDVTGRVRRITLAQPRMSLVADGQGLPHLALRGSAIVDVVALGGSDLRSGRYTLMVGARRESRRDEWRIWSFELQPQ